MDARGIAQATRRLVATLEHLGWQLHPDHPKADDIGFRFVTDGLLFDVLAPDGLGQRTDLTTLPPLKTERHPEDLAGPRAQGEAGGER